MYALFYRVWCVMAEVRPFVNGFINRIKSFTDNKDKKERSYLDIGDGDFCKVDGSTEDLLKCLVSNMKEFEGDMMVCVSQGDLSKSDASLRAIARKNGIALRIKKKIAISGIDDAICLKITKEDKKKFLKLLR